MPARDAYPGHPVSRNRCLYDIYWFADRGRLPYLDRRIGSVLRSVVPTKYRDGLYACRPIVALPKADPRAKPPGWHTRRAIESNIAAPYKIDLGPAGGREGVGEDKWYRARQLAGGGRKHGTDNRLARRENLCTG